MDSNNNSNYPEDGGLINLAALDEMFQGDTSFRHALLVKMHGQIPELMNLMAEEFDAQNFDAMGKTAHKLKSTITYLGVEEFRAVLQHIESVCKSGERLEDLGSALMQAQNLREAVMKELTGMI